MASPASAYELYLEELAATVGCDVSQVAHVAGSLAQFVADGTYEMVNTQLAHEGQCPIEITHVPHGSK